MRGRGALDLSEKHVTRAEIELGRRTLTAELEERRVPLVVCVFRHPVLALLGTSPGSGFQPQRTAWGARVFRMPGPFAAAEEVRAVMSELSDSLTPAS